MTKHERQKICKGVRKCHFDTHVRYAFEDVCVEALLHRLSMSRKHDAQCLKFDDLKNNLGSLYHDGTHIPEERMPNYKTKLIFNAPQFYLVIFTQRAEPFMPPFIIEFHPRNGMPITDYQDHLIWLNYMIPGLMMSSVEYTFDQHCKDPEHVKYLYNLERRCIYAPYVRHTNISEDENILIGNNVSLNGLVHFNNVKIYQRGDDNRRRGERWLSDDLNRVRIEYMADSRILRKHKIFTLQDFIYDTKFFEMTFNAFDFRCFSGSKKLPDYWEWDDYSAKDNDGNGGIFQLEHLRRRKEIQNISQYTKSIDAFDMVIVSMAEAAQLFDQVWQSEESRLYC
jgi:hypothetical protein